MFRRYVDHPRLNPLIERLYLAFKARPLADQAVRWLDMPAPDFEQRALAEASRPVEEMSEDIYAHLAWHAMCWDADHLPTLWYFLPRPMDDAVCEIVMPQRVASAHVPPEVLADRLILAQRQRMRWPHASLGSGPGQSSNLRRRTEPCNLRQARGCILRGNLG